MRYFGTIRDKKTLEKGEEISKQLEAVCNLEKRTRAKNMNKESEIFKEKRENLKKEMMKFRKEL